VLGLYKGSVEKPSRKGDEEYSYERLVALRGGMNFWTLLQQLESWTNDNAVTPDAHQGY
jgi:hypothetical protein